MRKCAIRFGLSRICAKLAAHVISSCLTLPVRVDNKMESVEYALMRDYLDMLDWRPVLCCREILALSIHTVWP